MSYWKQGEDVTAIGEKQEGISYDVARISVPLLPPPSLRGNSSQSKKDWAYREDYRTWSLFWQVAIRDWLKKRGWPAGVHIDPAVAHIIFVVPDRRRRDMDNYKRTGKAAFDAMVALGLLIDDSAAHLVDITGEMVVDKAEAPKTIIELRRVG